MTVYGYVRVSTQRQADEGESLGVQQRLIKGYCDMHAFGSPTYFIEEGVSGSKPLNERPAGRELIAALTVGDIIICAKLDRAFRSALDALTMVQTFKDMGVSLHLLDLGGDVSGNGLARTFFIIASAFAEAERDRIRSRVTATKADQRKRGRHLGGSRPFGYRIEKGENELRGGQLAPDEREQAAIKSLRVIAAAMREDGFSISHEGVAEVLRRDA